MGYYETPEARRGGEPHEARIPAKTAECLTAVLKKMGPTVKTTRLINVLGMVYGKIGRAQGPLKERR